MRNERQPSIEFDAIKFHSNFLWMWQPTAISSLLLLSIVNAIDDSFSLPLVTEVGDAQLPSEDSRDCRCYSKNNVFLAKWNEYKVTDLGLFEYYILEPLLHRTWKSFYCESMISPT